MISSDSHEVSQLNELKIDLDAIAVIAHYQANSNIIMDEQMPIFGGYAGGVEETTIVDIATHINAVVMSNASWHLDGPVHIRWGSTNTRETLMIAGWACATISEFTNILSGNQYYPCAGPCTEMCLLEAAAQAITDTASGREILSGVAAAKGVALDKTTGMEARMMGEAQGLLPEWRFLRSTRSWTTSSRCTRTTMLQHLLVRHSRNVITSRPLNPQMNT
jgi:methylamine--corrinoid protein Co-methyltransferase